VRCFKSHVNSVGLGMLTGIALLMSQVHAVMAAPPPAVDQAGYTYSPLNLIYSPPWTAFAAGARVSPNQPAPAGGGSWKFCTVQGKGTVWFPAAATVTGAIC
jgi:hypothetical protein